MTETLTLLPDVPFWAKCLIVGVYIFAKMALCGVVLGKTGRSPYLALLMIVPVPLLDAVWLWLFAFSAWPNEQAANTAARTTKQAPVA